MNYILANLNPKCWFIYSESDGVIYRSKIPEAVMSYSWEGFEWYMQVLASRGKDWNTFVAEFCNLHIKSSMTAKVFMSKFIKYCDSVMRK